MGDNFVAREECQSSLSRIHERTDVIANSVSRQEVIVERIEKSMDKLFKVVYGNGQNGIMNKINSNAISLKIHFGLVMLCLSSIVGCAFFVIRSIFK